MPGGGGGGGGLPFPPAPKPLGRLELIQPSKTWVIFIRLNIFIISNGNIQLKTHKEKYELPESCYTENRWYEKAHNWISVHGMNLKVLQEIDKFMIYNFGSQRKVRFPEWVSRKIQLHLLWFADFTEYRASVICKYLLLYTSISAEILWAISWCNLEQLFYSTHKLIRKGIKDKNSN